MEPSRCKAFLAAADQGSFAKAAEELNYTPSGVSQLVAALEKEFGFPLFIRKKKGVDLTTEGKQMLPAVRTFVQQERSIYQAAADIRGLLKHVTELQGIGTELRQQGFTVAFGKGANDGKYYKTGEGIRTYGNGYIKIESSSKTITKVVYTFQKATGTSGSGDDSVTYKTYPISSDCSVNTGSITVGEATVTWSGSSKSIIMTRAAGSGHWRLQKVEVTFAE